MRLDKFLAEKGIGSRSQVKDILKKGRVCVDGCIIKRPDFKLTIINGRLKNEVTLDEMPLVYQKYEYYMLNKPAGVISATKDYSEKTVLDLMETDRRDLFPVGRLDKDTEGLLIITNDGELSHNLLSPRKMIPKTYLVRVNGPIEQTHIKTFADGVKIHDRSKNEELVKLRESQLEILGSGEESEVKVTIVEGKYHQVKRMFAAIDRKVLYLKRLSMGSLQLDESLDPGEYRRLTEDELAGLGDNDERLLTD